MTEKLNPQTISFSFVPGLPLATVALVLFSGLTWPSPSTPHRFWFFGGLFFLMALAYLVSFGLFVKKSRHLQSVVDREPALKALNALGDREFFQTVVGAFRRMGYTLLDPEKPDRESVRSFRFVSNSRVTLVLLTRKKSMGSRDIRQFMTGLLTEGAERGMVIGTGLFTRGALRLARTGPVVLIDGVATLSLVSRHRGPLQREPGLWDQDLYPVNGEPFLDESSPFCPDCGSDMRLVPAGISRQTFTTRWICRKSGCTASLAYERHP